MFSSRARFRQFSLGLHLLALLLLWLWVVDQTRPADDLPDLAPEDKLECVSYAPYHLPGQTPLDPRTRISRAQIFADLQALAAMTRCVRTYSVAQGLDAVPEIAHSLGLRVWLGAWIGYDARVNETELEAAIALANRHPDTVRGLIVGNEVLLRREQPEAVLKTLLERARARTHVPVTYADVWEFWLRHPDLAGSVDLVTVHILPYWEDDPVPVAHTLPHIAKVLEEAGARFGKPVLIGETGWPGKGRQRAGARPGRVAQARYLRHFVLEAKARGWNYNVIEAIDQPWKRQLEGTVGGAWGILKADLQPRFPFAGPVAERNSLRTFALFSGLGALFSLSWSWSCGRRMSCGRRLSCERHFPRRTKTAFRRTNRLLRDLVVGAWLGGVLCLIWEHALDACRNAGEWGLYGGLALMGAGFVVSCGRRCSPCAHGNGKAPPGLPAKTAFLLLFALALVALLLCADPRYRDFPLWLFLMPLPTLMALQCAHLRQSHLEENVLCGLILLFGLARGALEATNPEALAWASICLAWGSPAIFSIFSVYSARKKTIHR